MVRTHVVISSNDSGCKHRHRRTYIIDEIDVKIVLYCSPFWPARNVELYTIYTEYAYTVYAGNNYTTHIFYTEKFHVHSADAKYRQNKYIIGPKTLTVLIWSSALNFNFILYKF